MSTEEQFSRLCELAGLKVNGSAPKDPQLVNPNEFYQAFARNPFLAMGESYVAGHYIVDDLFAMVSSFYDPAVQPKLLNLLTIRQKATMLTYHARRQYLNANKTYSFSDTRGQSKIAREHYDLDNDLMFATLGLSKKYTSGYWHPQYGAYDLDLAQRLDLDVIAKRLGLQPGMKVLDIGFGYGENTRYLVEKYGVHVTGITISAEQLQHAETVCANVKDKVNFVLSDWRSIDRQKFGLFDRIISLEMIESIGGPKNYSDFFSFINGVLKDNGSVLIQAINVNSSKRETNQWIEKYIFPNGVLPTPQSMCAAAQSAGLHLRLIDNSLGWANGQTCLAWWNNFEGAWPTLQVAIDQPTGLSKAEKYRRHFSRISPYPSDNDTFMKIWQFYLLGCAAVQIAGYVNDGHFIWEKNPHNVSMADILIPQTKAEIGSFVA